MAARSLLLLAIAAAASPARAAASNTTASWLAKRAALIHDVYGKGPGVLPTQASPRGAVAPFCARPCIFHLRFFIQNKQVGA